MRILFENTSINPKVSIILIDWSCRESLHIIHYLNNQTISRDNYEIIFIEYYDRCSPEIEKALKDSERSSKPYVIDKWIVMDVPKDICFHKHLMYNIGLISSKGDIIVICDSDAILRPTFIENIIKSFEKDRNIVLHMDEIRNSDKRFYPFSYPSIDDIIGHGCVNWINGTTVGLLSILSKGDFLHDANYGACMCALREDIINIGGADEHVDYLGLMCGPYDMTFRLINAGKREVWHQNEFIYHTYHPWQTKNLHYYIGPHDGRHMSTTALETRKNGRIMPLVENSTIRTIRLDRNIKIYINPCNIATVLEYCGIENIVIEGYRNILKREPDPGGLSLFTNRIKNGMSIDRFHDTLITSKEHRRRFG